MTQYRVYHTTTLTYPYPVSYEDLLESVFVRVRVKNVICKPKALLILLVKSVFRSNSAN